MREKLLEIVHEARQATQRYIKRAEITEGCLGCQDLGVIAANFEERLKAWQFEVENAKE